ncbi:glutathione S-transferase family protein [Nannocystis sp. ILAH1]|uniref:glutathione S-transferase family protein n=1 Tax=Nannocystis sp. ILAH1 TaxID=2996789 RepID=UPI0022719390|nr:glutathione S-transferase family protein [Nannocystis sp. ILAH1]MCY0991600.1 glutathione S-transferase family protein [Nannocystis sp. ILAH1]
MQIYWFKAQAPRRVVALAKHLGIAAEFVEVDLVGGDLKQPTYARLNPNMKAPTLVDGEFVLWESSAIMAHLCIQAGSDMWPAHAPSEQVEVMRWLGWNDCHWSEAVGPFYFEHIIKPSFGFGEPDREELKAKVDNLRRFARVLDRHLEGREFVACGRLTIADFHLASMATDWRESEMPLADFAHVVRWLERLRQLPAWADPWPQQRAAA